MPPAKIPVPPLIGRRAERRRLVAAMDRAASGRGSTVLISGPAGTGKTRLAGEVLRDAVDRGVLVLQGTAFPFQMDLGYAPFLEALGGHLSRLAGAERDRLVLGLPELGRLFAGLGGPVPLPGIDPALDRSRLFDAVAQLIARLAAGRPVALLIDDLHCADPATLDLLLYLARGLAGQPVLLLGCYRSEDYSGGQPARLAAFLRAVRRAGMVEEIGLGGLDPDEVGELVGAILGEVPPAALLDQLARRQADTPLFVGALVAALRDAGALQRRNRRWTVNQDAAVGLPAVVRDLVLGRLEQIGDSEREVMEWIVVAGDGASGPLLEEAIGREVAGELRGLVMKGLVAETVDGAEVRFRPAHPLLAEVTEDELPHSVRRRRHAAIALVLDGGQPTDMQRLAHHYRQAGGLLEAKRTLEVLLTAAAWAEAVHADDEAAAHLTAAIDATRASDPVQTVGLQERLGTALWRSGNMPDAIAVWRTAIQTRSAAGDRVGTARLHGLLAGAYSDAGRLADATAELDAGLALAIPGDVAIDLRLRRVRLMGRIGDLDELEREVDVLLPLVRKSGDLAATVALHMASSDAALLRGLLPEAVRHARLAVTAATSLGDPVTTSIAHRQVFVGELSKGNIGAAADANRADRAEARRAGIPSLLASTTMSELLLAVATDSWDEGLRRAESLLAIGRRVGTDRAVVAALAYRAYLLTMRGRLDEAAGLLAEAHETAPDPGPSDRHVFAVVDLCSAELEFALGDHRRAQGLASSAMSSPGLLPCLVMTMHCRASLAAGDLAAARDTAARLVAMKEGPWTAACGAVLDGLVAPSTDPRAPAQIAHGAEALDAIGMPFQSARARLDLARIAADRGHAELALGAARSALTVFERFDARPFMDQCRRVLRELGDRPAVAARQAGRAGELSDREREVVALVAAGLSNIEVASRLFISPRTVTTHLQHVYARLGLPSRSALVRWVIEQSSHHHDR